MRRDGIVLSLCAIWFGFLAWRGLDYGLPRANYPELLFRREEAPQVLAQVVATREADRQRTETYKTFWGQKLVPPPQYVREITREEPWIVNGQVKYRSVNKLKWIGAQLLTSQIPDEQNILHAISQMRPERLDFNPRFFSYGGIHVFSVAASLVLGKALGFVELTTDRLFYLTRPEHVQRMFLIGKGLGIVAGFLLVILVYVSGRVLVNRGVGLAAAALASSYPAYIVEAHHLKPFLWSACWVLLCLIAFAVWQRKRQQRWLVLTGLAAGLAAGTCYIAGAVIGIPLLSLMWEVWGVHEPGRGRHGMVRAVGLTAMMALLGFLASNPYLLTSPFILINDIRKLSDLRLTQVSYLDPRLHLQVLREISASLGTAGTICVLLGLLVGLVRLSRADRWLIGGCLAFYLLAFKAIVFANIVHHLVPMMALPLLICVRWLPEVMHTKRVWVRSASALLLASMIVEMGRLGWRYSGLYAEPSPAIAAGMWINDHVGVGARIGSWIHSDGVRLGYPVFRYLDYQFVHDDDPQLPRLRTASPDYLIAIIRPSTPEPLLTRQDLLDHYRLAARFVQGGTQAFSRGEWRPLVPYLIEEVQIYQRVAPSQQVVRTP